jgi:hypothetical protein
VHFPLLNISAAGVQCGKSCLPGIGKTYDIIVIVHAKTMVCTDVIDSYNCHFSILMALLPPHMVELSIWILMGTDTIHKTAHSITYK